MLEKFNLEEILKKNPAIRREEVEKNTLIAEQLSKAGMKPHGYQLAQPFNSRRVKIEGDEYDPRTVNLTALRH